MHIRGLVISGDARLTDIAETLEVIANCIASPALSIDRDSLHFAVVKLEFHFIFQHWRLAASEHAELAEVISARLTVIEELLMLQIAKTALLTSNRWSLCSAQRTVSREIGSDDSAMH